MSERELDSIRDDIRILNNKIEHINERMFNMIKEDIKFALNEEGFKNFLISTTKEFIRDNFKELIEKVTKETIARLNKNINQELIITKSLCYSIDTEIKHTIRNLDTSAHTDHLIKNKIDEHINRISKELILKSMEVDNIKLLK
jgi:hypothetical protein